MDLRRGPGSNIRNDPLASQRTEVSYTATSAYTRSLQSRPDIVILQFGTNDAKVILSLHVLYVFFLFEIVLFYCHSFSYITHIVSSYQLVSSYHFVSSRNGIGTKNFFYIVIFVWFICTKISLVSHTCS